MFTHDIFRNLRVRALIVHEGKLLILPRPNHTGGSPPQPGAVPGGGLLPNESLYEAVAREVLEETGLRVQAKSVAFLREWVVPKQCPLKQTREMVASHLAARGEEMVTADYAFGLEVYIWADLVPGEGIDPTTYDKIEGPVHWVPFDQVEQEPVFPKELRALARDLAAGGPRVGVPSFVTCYGTPWDKPDYRAFRQGEGT
jgi:8-oxo-dGTP pyrophosphatase MutT (NUDIX family)